MTTTSQSSPTSARSTTKQRRPRPARAGADGKKRELRVLAYEVSEDYEGRAEIVWTTSTAAARRLMMGEWNKDFNELSTKRVPELDGFKGDIDEWKFEHDWWQNCGYRDCHKERCAKDDGSVYRDGLWCCCDEHVVLEEERIVREAERKQDVTREALRLKPGSTVHDIHFNPNDDALIDMTFPSGVRRYHTFLDWLASDEGQRA